MTARAPIVKMVIDASVPRVDLAMIVRGAMPREVLATCVPMGHPMAIVRPVTVTKVLAAAALMAHHVVKGHRLAKPACVAGIIRPAHPTKNLATKRPAPNPRRPFSLSC